MKALYVCGMKEEADLVPRGTLVVMGTGRRSVLINRLGALNPQDISSVTSFGTCGGLNPVLRPGDIVVDQLFKVLTDDLLFTANQKAIHFNAGYDVVDEETAYAEAFARRNGLRFNVIRAVADPADFTLPPASRLALKPDGTPDYWAITKNIAANPGQIPALTRFAGYNTTALRSLKSYLTRHGYR